MAQHPLEPLSGDEFRQTAEILRRDQGVTDSWRFASIELKEPPKTEVKAWRRGDPVPRTSFAVLWNREDNLAYEATVDLTGGSVVSWTHVPGVCPNFTVDEWHECDVIMREHPDVLAALARRGVTDMSLVLIDVWTYAKALMPEKWRDRRLGWCDVWRRDTPAGNPYAHLVAGMKFVVDMNTMELLEIEEDSDPGSPDVQAEYIPGVWTGELRTDLKPLHISQPEGVSFTVDGTELRWQNWSMRLGFNYREGPVIYQVSYDDHGEVRDIAYRMSFAEMVVPYRDGSFDHYRRTAYDIGEWGLGFMTTSLELGCDCLGEIVYVDAALHDSKGEPYTITNAICLHEEDNAVLWKHIDGTTGAEVRRMRRMVVSCHVTVANYEYLVYWRFYQDGNIECEVRATGLMVTTPFAEGAEAPATGTVVDNRTYAPFHQHFIIARLDLDVDGAENTVLEVDSQALPVSEDNLYGLDLVTTATPVRSEAEAGRDYSWERQRGWKVVNPNRTNRHGTNTAYKLVPTACFPAMMDPSTVQYVRSPVIGHTVWVTQNHDDERWPAGAYPTQSMTDDGMTRWIADDEPLENTDVVLWYVFGLHHVTRAEDWPIMPADVISFWLKPFGFFDQNPAIDVAPSERTDAEGLCHTGVDDEHAHQH
ncbi:MAG TPA: primary-amine oxidase [Kribbella sp.]|nr:primary-amine oxidase [Kribbella sp.]